MQKLQAAWFPAKLDLGRVQTVPQPRKPRHSSVNAAVARVMKPGAHASHVARLVHRVI